MQKEYKFGNSKITVFSPLAQMTKDEQKEFFRSEWKKGNKVLQDLAQAAHDCLSDQSPIQKLEKYS